MCKELPVIPVKGWWTQERIIGKNGGLRRRDTPPQKKRRI
jgi:hypothetical protein